MARQAVIIFTRIPVPGKVKTRLVGKLSSEECADVQEAMILDLMNKLNSLTEENKSVFVCYSDEMEPTDFLRKLPQNFQHFPQQGVTIGQRMNQAFQTLFSNGFEQVVLIGSDIPGITPQNIRRAFRLLSDHDVVIGPSFDGGYYLLGANQQSLDFLFLGSGLAWGSESIYQQTLIKLVDQHLLVAQVETLADVDYHRDLVRYLGKILPDNHVLNSWLSQKEVGFRQ